MTERFEDVIKEARKSVKVEHYHRIEITSNWVFLSFAGMALMILGLSYFIGNQRQTTIRYKDNDLKYRYIQMQGQINDENLYRLEQQFKYNDSIKIIRKQVERYEELVKEHAEKLYRMENNSEEIEILQKQMKMTKSQRFKQK
jgi:hypothetical protein